MKNRPHNVKPRKPRYQHRPLVGMVVLEDNRPSKKSVSIVANNILEAVDPKNRAIVLEATKAVLEKTTG